MMERDDSDFLQPGELEEQEAIIAFAREADGGDRIEKMRNIVKVRAARKVDGVLVDMQSANAVVTVYDALALESNKAKYMSMPVRKQVETAWKLVR